MELKYINSLVELFFRKSEENIPKKYSLNEPAFLTNLKSKDHELAELREPTSYSWRLIDGYVRVLSNYLKKKISKGDRCILLSENRPEWLVSDLSIMNAGGVTVPLFTTYSNKDYEYIIKDCSPKVCIVSNQEQFDKIKKYITKDVTLISIDGINEEAEFFHNIFTNYQNNFIDENFKILHPVNSDLKRNDLACIIYTSGTTGNPKGVMLSHGGILSNCEGALDILIPLFKNEKPVFLTWLPLSHSYEHAVQFVQIILEAKVFYNKSIETLLPTIKIAQPHIMTAVPRFYNNLHAKMKINLKNQSNLKQNLFNKTIQLGTKKFKNIKLSFSENIFNLILDKLVRKKVKNNFGGRLEAFISGGGPLDRQVGEALNALGLKTLQGYGLTETSPVVSCNLLNKVKVDTVGPIFPGVEVKLAEDGEILVKGENLMLGYWNNKEATEQTIKDGWLHTGDIGEFDDDNYLKITDRKKDIIVSLGGDNIAPSKIENLLTLSPEIEQACVFGEQKNYIAALLVLSSESKSSDEDIQRYIDEVNKDLTQPEKIKKFIFIDEPFSIENNLMTPTMKVRRHEVQKKYQNQIDQLF